MQKAMYGQFENTFMMYLPRLCEHCLNPACVATCPSGAIYKREEDGIVLIDQDKCRGWRMCITGCPYKKIYFNWKSGKSENVSSATRVLKRVSRRSALRHASVVFVTLACCCTTRMPSKRRQAPRTRRPVPASTGCLPRSARSESD